MVLVIGQSSGFGHRLWFEDKSATKIFQKIETNNQQPTINDH
jgi:hypothetical protein